MDKTCFVVVACLDKDAVAFFSEGVVECLYYGVLSLLDNNINYYFDVTFLLAYPLV